MRVLVCPDKFAGSLSAVAAAQAIADGWRSAAPDDEVDVRPMSDGGPGFVAVLAEVTGGRRVPVETCDPLGRPVTGEILVIGDAAYVESAHACGLHLLDPAERDPKWTTSYGLGALVTAAVETGVRTVVIGLGGSAVNDCGAGALAALGVSALDLAGYALPYGGAALAACATLTGTPRLRDAALVAATDVDNPLTGPYGASAVYGPQKGATPDDIAVLDAALAHFAGILVRDLPGCPPGLAALPGAGAAGGLGAAIMAIGGRCESGIGMVRWLAGLDKALDEAELVITGEGMFDDQSVRGKVVAGVAAAARERGRPCLVLAGQVTADRHLATTAGVLQAYSLVEHFGSVERAMADAAPGLREMAARIATRWSGR
jgi:glycerate 2-kinase